MKNKKISPPVDRNAAQYSAHADEMTGDYTVKVGRRQEIAARILCAVAAVIVWLYVMNIDRPDFEKTFTGVPVSIENEAKIAEEYNMSVISGYESTVNVTVTGKKSEISKYTAQDIAAFVDLGTVNRSGKHQLEIAASAPAGLTVTGVSPASVLVYTDVLSTKTVAVDVKPYYQAESSVGLGATQTNIQEVMVTGPAGVLDSIAFARAEVDLGQISTSMTLRVPLKLVDEHGGEITNPYVHCDATDVLVTIPVYVYKEVPVTIGFKYGLLNADNCRAEITPAKITVRGDPQLLADFDQYQVMEIDETKILGNYLERKKLSLPEGILDVDKVEIVQIELSHVGTTTKALAAPIRLLKVTAPDDLAYEFVESSLNFTIRAPESEINVIYTRDFSLSIDLTNYVGVTGTVTVPVTISVADQTLEGRAYAVGTYNVQVRIS